MCSGDLIPLCSLVLRLLEEVAVNLNEVHPDVQSLFFVIAARHGLTSHASGPSQTPSPQSRGVSDLSTAGELPRVQMRACGAGCVLSRYVYDEAVFLGAEERTEGVVVARLARVHAGSPCTSSNSTWELEAIGYPMDRDGANTAIMGSGTFSPSAGLPSRSFLHGIKRWVDSVRDDYASNTANGVANASGYSTPTRHVVWGSYDR